MKTFKEILTEEKPIKYKSFYIKCGASSDEWGISTNNKYYYAIFNSLEDAKKHIDELKR